MTRTVEILAVGGITKKKLTITKHSEDMLGLKLRGTYDEINKAIYDLAVVKRRNRF